MPIEELDSSYPWANWLGSSAVPVNIGFSDVQAITQKTAMAGTLELKIFENNLIIIILLGVSCQREQL
jgi:hypothetical protein